MHPRKWGQKEAVEVEYRRDWTSQQGLRWEKKKKEAGRKRGFWSEDPTFRSIALAGSTFTGDDRVQSVIVAKGWAQHKPRASGHAARIGGPGDPSHEVWPWGQSDSF